MKHFTAVLQVLAFLLFFSMLSCDPDRVYEENVLITEHKWNRNNLLQFQVNITDTVSSFNLYVNIRNGGDYSYRNLFLFINTYAPTGQWVRDTVNCILANEKGKWFGSGIGDIYDIQIPYKKNVRFPYPGIYSFTFEQAMRTEELSHVYDVGLRIEKTKPK
ncbi:MAG: gliding motility lipoprotein GldH [Bacteroidales bacterium]|nr:gliding motility lipoprotein GldH [Bacteroidales bacterium]